ncbi:MAG: hypothetical protein ACE14M_10555 [Terriglobales bacterium]
MKAILVIALFFGTAAALAEHPKPAPPPTEDFSGMYSFLQEGEFVQITVEDKGHVTGFVSRYGDLPSDKGAFLDQFIKNGALDGHKLTFVTDPVHGVWFEFRGSVARGEGKASADEDYYELRGTLIQYITDPNKKTTARSREVVFKSFPKFEEPPPSKRD